MSSCQERICYPTTDDFVLRPLSRHARSSSTRRDGCGAGHNIGSALVAKWIEHLTTDQKVGSSSPPRARQRHLCDTRSRPMYGSQRHSPRMLTQRGGGNGRVRQEVSCVSKHEACCGRGGVGRVDGDGYEQHCVGEQRRWGVQESWYQDRHSRWHARVHARDLGQEQGKTVLVSNAELRKFGFRKFGLSEWLIEFQRRHNNNNNNNSAPVG